MDLSQLRVLVENVSNEENSTDAPFALPHTEAVTALIVLVVVVIVSVTIVGNVLVIVAVLTSRALRAPQNLFLVSLASADILVATLVIPFSLSNEVMGYWYFGSTWCAFYLALDVLFCTSSIVHLCAISLDRYWSVTKAVSYNLKRTPKRIKGMIAVVWIISAVISFPPLLLTKHDERKCLLTDETWYILSSCVVSFFAPGLIMILVYFKIYKVAKQRSSTVFVAKNGLERQPSQSETCFVRKDGFEMESPSSQSSGTPQQRQGELDDIDLEESCGASDTKARTHRFSKRRKVEGSENCPPQNCRMSWASSRASAVVPGAEEPGWAAADEQNESGPDARKALHFRPGGGHGGVCPLLVPFFLYLHAARYLQRQVLHSWRTFQPVLLDWILQQLSEPHHLHHFQQGLQEIF
ncbi:hypothetical protein fugu_013296 [Takifugu bimaculatus]|uniref:G-protein coupled receptors family 1 profile domain-containing protein n=1 Tax=Takifugu bimaculatus TaxID=433685 RepID=A0A4Z2C3A4_9TELE|nr:hypothetical protein fugu_013296 [Takifugu bimaculatus]